MDCHFFECRYQLSVLLCLVGLMYAVGALELENAPAITSLFSTDFGTQNPYRSFNNIINSWFLHTFKLQGVADHFRGNLGEDGSYYFECYLRDLVMGTFVYWGTAGIWHIFIYHIFREQLFTRKGRPLPTNEIILDQMLLAQCSLFIYAGLPVISEYLIESNYTQAYFYVSDIGGWGYYFLYWFLYVCFVEVGVYWAHRTLHENKFLYKYVHGLHHKYNTSETLTPWASIAFNPIDGMIQVSVFLL